ncbi:predicted protein [Nematostella vectensis]|uniref:Tetratricopeptide repeat protein 38 n=1 Tax=Nematostella vectensis TaxID=45351 RepID=A7RFK6_NEMVE|nr:predicted protein [Nematostella vectensis]|eukprot:XP_001641680.1 predicted protein [Nematostella vectensis]
MSYLHSHWRDLKAWEDEGLPFTTPSNEAVKMYDAAVSQMVGHYVDPVLESPQKALDLMLEADPDFVMGQVLSLNLALWGKNSPAIQEKVDKLMELACRTSITPREKLHVEAVKELSLGNPVKACLIWDDILTTYPTDMMAIKISQETFFFTGLQKEMRDSVARVLPRWKPSIPLYPYLFGMLAFGLEETNFYHEAEKQALRGLELAPTDCWATHARAHVLEMTGRQDEGIAFMSKTLNDWVKGDGMAGHNFWHWALYHIEKGEYDAAWDIYDSQLAQRCKTPGSTLDLTDASSFLYRMEVEGQNVGDRWVDLLPFWAPHVDDHNMIFNDAHMLMCTLGAKDEEMTLKLMKSLQEYVSEGSSHNCTLSREVGVTLCEALVLADKGDFPGAVELLKPIRYRLIAIGGSHAQRDVFNLLLIHAALQSSRNEHKLLARSLLAERKALKENAPMTDRLMARAKAQYLS